MSSEWRTASLLDHYEVRSGLSKPAKDFGSGYPFLTFKDVFYNYFTPEHLGDFVQATEKEREGCSILRGDVFLTRTSETMHELGMSCVALRSYKDATFNGFCKRLRPKPGSELLPEYVGYYLRSPVFRQAVSAMSTMSTRASLNNEMIGRLEISFPPIEVQVRISEILRSLDSRISLLRETNATLEAIAQALFKSWFVDFDPVHAKMAGREPEGMDAATAALFPDSFEESELGLVPRGWEVLPLRQLCTFQKGCSYKGDGLADGEGAYMFNLGCFNEPRVYAFQKVKRYVGDYKPKHQVCPGDLIIANTDMTQQRDILGRPLLVPSGMVPGFISHHVFKVEVAGKFGSQIRNFLFFSFQQVGFRERAVGYATGTTVLALPRDALEEHCVVLPSQSLLMAFSDVVSPLLATIHENEERATLLTQLRDTLLPRLISGQLRLPEAQAAVKDACA